MAIVFWQDHRSSECSSFNLPIKKVNWSVVSHRNSVLVCVECSWRVKSGGFLIFALRRNLIYIFDCAWDMADKETFLWAVASLREQSFELASYDFFSVKICTFCLWSHGLMSSSDYKICVCVMDLVNIRIAILALCMLLPACQCRAGFVGILDTRQVAYEKRGGMFIKNCVEQLHHSR